MKITVYGLGYVGVVSAACLSRDGHEVIGVDPNIVKTDMIAAGESPIVEPGLADLIANSVAAGSLKTMTKYKEAASWSDLILVCVGTPSRSNGELDLEYVKRVSEEIGQSLQGANGFPVVAMRSTMLPGSMASVVIPTLEHESGKEAGKDFGICINPEFLREGTAIYDYDHPPKTVVGTSDDRSAGPLKEIYGILDAPLFVTSLATAEMIKYADNSWHALKVAYANEIGRICKVVGIDSRELMDLFCEDKKLNISPAYLKPGFAFGGSCLPKDVRAISYLAKTYDVDLPIITSLLPSNRVHIDSAYDRILRAGSKKVGILGLSFKEGTDDLRESPIVTLAEKLIGKGFELCIYDRNVKLASLVGANKEYILQHIPHINRLLVAEPEQLLCQSNVIVLATGEQEFGELALSYAPDKIIVDLVGKWSGELEGAAGYDGIGW